MVLMAEISKLFRVRRDSRKYQLANAQKRFATVGNWMKLSTSNFHARPLAGIRYVCFPSARRHELRQASKNVSLPFKNKSTEKNGTEGTDFSQKKKKGIDTISIEACHPCAGTMLIFSVSFQF